VGEIIKGDYQVEITQSTILSIRALIRCVAGGEANIAEATRYSIQARQLYQEEIAQEKIKNRLHVPVSEILESKEAARC
jgi:hypothetical protein